MGQDDAIREFEVGQRSEISSPDYETTNVEKLLLRAARNISNAFRGPAEPVYTRPVTCEWDAGVETTGKRMAECIDALSRSGFYVRHGDTGLRRWTAPQVRPSQWMFNNGLYPLDAELVFKDKKVYAVEHWESISEDLGDVYSERSKRNDLFAGRIITVSGGGPLLCVVGFRVSA